MGMTAGGGGGKHAEPEVNVTPLVDVALVVLIIFMVVAPMTVKTFWLNLPQKTENTPPPPPEEVDEAKKPLVMTIAKNGVIRVNKTVVEKAEIAERLPRMLAAKPEDRRILYFDAHDDVPYGTAVEVMDLSRAAGARSIAILTSKVAGE